MHCQWRVSLLTWAVHVLRFTSRRLAALLALALGWPLLPAQAIDAFDAERIGLTAMRRERPSIRGMGIPVAQPEEESNRHSFSVVVVLDSDYGCFCDQIAVWLLQSNAVVELKRMR